MTKVALIFPGQGAQKVGMGREFYDTSPAAKAVFEQAQKILGKNNFLQTIFAGPQEKLTSTAYCQPAILAFSIAALKALQAHPKSKNITPKFAAGLSLGEYSALAANGALSFEDALKLVERRSFFMEEAAKVTAGTMAAVIGFNKERLKAVCQETGAEIANFNSPEQIVITGHTKKVEAACKMIKKEGARAVIPLDVSGAFHSSLMHPAAVQFKKVLKEVKISAPRFPVLSNVDALPEENPENIREKLHQQITSSVQWVATIEQMAKDGIDTFLEIGPGTILRGLIRRINPALKVYNIQMPGDIENLPL